MTEETTATAPPAKEGGGGGGKKEKKAPPNIVIPPKKPQLSKAERRALQEAQRAAKAAGGGKKLSQQQQKDEGGKDNNNNNNAKQQPQGQNPQPKQGAPQQQQQQQQTTKNNPKSDKADAQTKPEDDKKVDLFSHLPQYKDLPDPFSPELTSTLHPDVIDLGMKYATGAIRGGNARCRAMLKVFLNVLDDYFPPENVTDYRAHFDHDVLKPSFTFWTTRCRPHSVSMGNAFTFVKTAVASLGRDLPLEDAKEILNDTIARFLQERMEYADRAIAQHAMDKIADGDVILTFGNSEVISVLLTTAKQEKNFYVWVVDARPLWEGEDLLETLRAADIPCGYIQLNAVSYVMQKNVTKVFLGASALMSNGSVYGRAGTSCVAMLANDKHIPVLVCCETYKISNKVQLESITQNELGNPDALVHGESLQKWRETPDLKLLNLLYDLTPPEFVSGIVTEVGIIPSTSVAVLLREMNPQDAAYKI